jgi:hypothetical protein
MRKILTAFAATALVAGAALATPGEAQARGGWVPGLIGGLAAGAVIGGIAAANSPYYGPYGYYPAYGYAPGCAIRRERVWNGYAYQWQRVRVCY